MLKNKKGFTLVELVVTIAVDTLAVAVVLAVFSLFHKLNNQNLTEYSKTVDTMRIQLRIKNWVRQYDNIKYEFTTENTTKCMVKKWNATNSEYEPFACLDISDDKKSLVVKYKDGTADEILYTAEKEISLSFEQKPYYSGSSKSYLYWELTYNNEKNISGKISYYPHVSAKLS